MFNVWPFIRHDAAHHRIANDAVLGSAFIADDAIFFLASSRSIAACERVFKLLVLSATV